MATKRKKTAFQKTPRRPRTSVQIERNLAALVQFPGVDLALLYRGIVEESRKVGDAPGTPAYPYSAPLLDKVVGMMLQAEIASGKPNDKIVAKLQRGIHGAEGHRVARYVAESTLGASALSVDGVNRLLKLRGDLKAEKASGRTINNMPEKRS